MMNVLLPYRSEYETLLPLKLIFEKEGHFVKFFCYESATGFREIVSKNAFDLVVSSECEILCKIKSVDRRAFSVVYYSPYIYPDKRLSSIDCDAYWIPFRELSSAFIKAGARDKKVHPIGIPGDTRFTTGMTKSEICHKWGIPEKDTIISIYADDVSRYEVCSTVASLRNFHKTAQILLFVNGKKLLSYYAMRFAGDYGIFAIEKKGNESFGFAVADFVFIPANLICVSAAVRSKKNMILLHSNNKQIQNNAHFLSQNGIAFIGETAADNASFSARLIENIRLRNSMLSAQNKFISSDAEEIILLEAKSLLKNCKND